MRLFQAISIFAAVFLIQLQPAYAEIDAALTQYLKSISEFKTIRYGCQDYADLSSVKPTPARKKLGNLALLKSFDAVFDFKDNSYKITERIYLDGQEGSINRVRAWHNGLLHEYIEDDSPGLGKGEAAANGIVTQKPYEVSDLPGGPRTALGFGITEPAGQSINLSDLASEDSLELLSENRYRLKNIFKWDESFGAAYDLEFTLDPQHGHLLSKYSIFERRFRGEEVRQLIADVEVNKFLYVDKIWLPVDITKSRFRGGKVDSVHRFIVEGQGLKLNALLSTRDFEATFPAGKTFVDTRTLTLHEPNQPPRDVSRLFHTSDTVQSDSPLDVPNSTTFEYANSQRYRNVLLLFFAITTALIIALLIRRSAVSRTQEVKELH